MSLWHWALVAGLLFAAARAAIDIALDRVREEPSRRVALQAVLLAIGSFVWLLAGSDQAPVPITGLLLAAARGGQAWLLRDLPAPTLPPVRY